MTKQLIPSLKRQGAFIEGNPSAHPLDPTLGFNADLWTDRIRIEQALRNLSLVDNYRSGAFSFVDQVIRERGGRSPQQRGSFAEMVQSSTSQREPNLGFAEREGIRRTNTSKANSQQL